jgi:TP901-1 family phage major tail protein
MSSQRGRDLLLKIGNGGAPETFAVIGATRLVTMTLGNQLVDTTAMDGSGTQTIQPDAGLQALEVTLEGLFKDAAAEEALRQSAFSRTIVNYQLLFPNGDVLTAAFAIADYRRSGSFEGLENFSVTLVRSGEGSFI